MTAADILEALAAPSTFPDEAIAEALSRRETLAPVFIEKLGEWAAGRGYPSEGFYYLPAFAVFLLAEWRETSAFKPVLRLFASPQADDLVGDDIAEDGGMLLARLYDGDHAALEAIVLDETVDEFVRDAALDAYVRLAQEETVPLEQVHAFLKRLFAELPREENYIWVGIADAVASLEFRDLVPEVKRLFDEETIGREFMDFEDFESDQRKAESGLFPNRLHHGSPVERMRSWRFTDEIAGERSFSAYSDFTDEELEAVAGLYHKQPAINEYRDTGRNDPCPCGSGKKFKKCCLPRVEAGEI